MKFEAAIRGDLCHLLLKDVNDKAVALRDLKGKTVLLDFWATWCEPCREYSYLNLLDPERQAFQAYGGRGIPIMVMIDKDGVVRYYHEGYGPAVNIGAAIKKFGQ